MYTTITSIEEAVKITGLPQELYTTATFNLACFKYRNKLTRASMRFEGIREATQLGERFTDDNGQEWVIVWRSMITIFTCASAPYAIPKEDWDDFIQYLQKQKALRANLQNTPSHNAILGELWVINPQTWESKMEDMARDMFVATQIDFTGTNKITHDAWRGRAIWVAKALAAHGVKNPLGVMWAWMRHKAGWKNETYGLFAAAYTSQIPRQAWEAAAAATSNAKFDAVVYRCKEMQELGLPTTFPRKSEFATMMAELAPISNDNWDAPKTTKTTQLNEQLKRNGLL